ncbi:MAG TPA: C45 family autoproteolytic acyltransferase/hydrolase, partial [Candidatus Acidoferrum sp.]|nr:C45 family autoproteolytic acyltransferase/hydrolase [Candidatus Acidoferrum sp.]
MMKPRRQMAWLTLAALFTAPIWPTQSHACTLFAAAGKKVKGGGVLIAKNRDWRPDNSQSLRLVSPKTGYRYFGLFAEGNDEPGLKAGINEKGLVVVSATASIPKAAREAMPRTKNLLGKLLTCCTTVDEALQHREWFQGPRYLLLADRGKAASIEIGPAGKSQVAVTDRSVLYHTNHYVTPALQDQNPNRIGQSSLERYRRVEDLLRQASQLDLEDFI